MAAGDEARGYRFDVALHPRDLAREKDRWPRPQLERRRQKQRPVDVRIPVNLAVAEKLRSLEAGDHPKQVCLLRKTQVVLKTDQIVAVRAGVFLPELEHCVRPPPGPRIAQTHGLHGTEAKRVASAAGDLLNGQASLKKRRA